MTTACKILNEVVDWIIEESSEDICQKCIWLDLNYKDVPDDEASCLYRKVCGAKACRCGMIAYFKRKLDKDGEKND